MTMNSKLIKINFFIKKSLKFKETFLKKLLNKKTSIFKNYKNK